MVAIRGHAIKFKIKDASEYFCSGPESYVCMQVFQPPISLWASTVSVSMLSLALRLFACPIDIQPTKSFANSVSPFLLRQPYTFVLIQQQLPKKPRRGVPA
jgi:hypothetical protein